MSPRNTAAAIIKLMKDTACHRLLTTRETLRPLIDEITAELSKEETSYPLTVEEIPPLAEIFPRLGNETVDDPFKPYPRAPRPPLDNVIMYLHSSGSTGLPKTIKQTFRSMVHWAGLRKLLYVAEIFLSLLKHFLQLQLPLPTIAITGLC